MFPFRFFLVAVLAFLITTSNQPVSAQSDNAEPGLGFSISIVAGDDPTTTENGYFVFERQAGVTAEGTVHLINKSDRQVTIALAAVDSLTSQGGGSAFAASDVTPSAIGTWLDLKETKITLEAGTDRDVSFSVNAPKETKPGQYLAGISAQAVDDTKPDKQTAANEGEASVGINLKSRYVIAVQIDVPGTWDEHLNITGVSLIDQSSGSQLIVELVNSGGVFVKPTGKLTLTGADGTIAQTIPIEMGSIITGTSGLFVAPLPATLSVGSYQAHVQVSYGKSGSATFDTEIVVTDDSTPAVEISDLTVTAVRNDATKAVQFVTVDVAINNPGPDLANGRLTLHVSRDGEKVEDLVVADALTFPSGVAQTSLRYLPIAGWTSGTYTFSMTLDVVDPANGQATTLSEITAPTEVKVK